MSIFDPLCECKADLWLPFRSQFVSGGLQSTQNLGKSATAPALVTVGDGITATTYPTQLYPRGLKFDGGDYLNAGNAANWTDNFTMLALIGVRTGLGGRLFARRSLVATQYDLFVEPSNGTIRGYNGSVTRVGPNAWYMSPVVVAFVVSGGNLTMYVNSESVAPTAFVVATVDTPTLIGAAQAGGVPGSFFTGTIYAAAAYPTAFSPLQVYEWGRRARQYSYVGVARC